MGRITQVQAPNTGTIDYSYDARGQRTQLTYPDSTTLDYGYWADGQLHTVMQGATTLASYSYDSAGRLQQLVASNGMTTTTSYDNADRLTDLRTTVGSSDVSRFQYTLDRLGLRTHATETLSSTRAITYTYDGLLRLSGATESPGATYAYGYDNAGNRTSVTVNGTTTATSYNVANQVSGYTYDNAGNLTNDGTTYSYDALSRLAIRGTTTYTYNGDGALVFDGTTRYTQDLAAPLSQVLQTIQGSTTSDYLYGRERLTSVVSGVRTWYGSDALGSVRQTLSDVGIPLGVVNYDPWGTIESGTVPTFGFTGELQDSATGLVNLRARWYHTGRGTFTSVDRFAGFSEQPYSQHPYAYALSNPVLNSDPSGHCSRQGDDYCFPDAGDGRAAIVDWAQFQAYYSQYFAFAPDLARNPPQVNNAGHILTPSEAAEYAEAYMLYISNPSAYPYTVRSTVGVRAAVFAEYFLHISLTDVEVSMALGQVQAILASAKREGRPLTDSESTCVLKDAAALGFAYGGMQNGLAFLGGGFRGFIRSGDSEGYPGEVGIGYGGSKGKTLEEKELIELVKGVNDGPEWNRLNNCSQCAEAVNARLGGNKNAGALPGLPQEYTVLEARYGGHFQPMRDPDQIRQAMLGQQEGARGIIYADPYNPNDIGHAFNVVKYKGSVYFVDGQNEVLYSNQDLQNSWRQFWLLKTYP